MTDLGGRRVLVTGGTSGIGAAVVDLIRADGALVAFTGRDPARGADVSERTGAFFVPADTRHETAVAESVTRSLELLGGLDGLVLNAGVLHEARLCETSDEHWDAILDTNLVGPYLYAQACLPALRATGGSIVAVASDAGIWPAASIGAYSVAERSLTWLAQMLAVEAAPDGVRVNAVCPGDIAPGMASHVEGQRAPSTDDWLLPPAGRFGAVEDVARAVRFFLSPESTFCAGSALLVDGGMRASLRSWAVHQS